MTKGIDGVIVSLKGADEGHDVPNLRLEKVGSFDIVERTTHREFFAFLARFDYQERNIGPAASNAIYRRMRKLDAARIGVLAVGELILSILLRNLANRKGIRRFDIVGRNLFLAHPPPQRNDPQDGKDHDGKHQQKKSCVPARSRPIDGIVAQGCSIVAVWWQRRWRDSGREDLVTKRTLNRTSAETPVMLH